MSIIFSVRPISPDGRTKCFYARTTYQDNQEVLFLPLLLSAINRVKRILFLLTSSHNYARVTNLYH